MVNEESAGDACTGDVDDEEQELKVLRRKNALRLEIVQLDLTTAQVKRARDAEESSSQREKETALADREIAAAKLAKELDAARHRTELARLTAERTTAELPRWSKAVSVAGIVAILGAAVPAMTAMWSYFDKERQLALEREKYLEASKNAYLDRLKGDEERARTLRLIHATSTDPTLKQWAWDEMLIVRQSIESVKSLLKQREGDVADTSKKIDEAIANGKPEKSVELLLVQQKAQIEEVSRLQQKLYGLDLNERHGGTLGTPVADGVRYDGRCITVDACLKVVRAGCKSTADKKCADAGPGDACIEEALKACANTAPEVCKDRPTCFTY